jgi:hypothetical protein
VFAFLFPEQPDALAVMGWAKEDDARRQRLSSVDQRGAYEPASGLPFVSGAVLVPGETSRLACVEGLPVCGASHSRALFGQSWIELKRTGTSF